LIETFARSPRAAICSMRWQYSAAAAAASAGLATCSPSWLSVASRPRALRAAAAASASSAVSPATKRRASRLASALLERGLGRQRQQGSSQHQPTASLSQFAVRSGEFSVGDRCGIGDGVLAGYCEL
jgi:hypothetical protein